MQKGENTKEKVVRKRKMSDLEDNNPTPSKIGGKVRSIVERDCSARPINMVELIGVVEHGDGGVVTETCSVGQAKYVDMREIDSGSLVGDAVDDPCPIGKANVGEPNDGVAVDCVAAGL